VDASPEHPVLVDKFLEDAFEFDVDAVADATGAVVIGGIMEHIEEAGIHSGDSSCVVPPFICPERHLATIRDYTRRIARSLKVVGLMTMPPFAENPEASRPHVARLAELAAQHGLPQLSMGTSQDFAVAAAEGATIVRIGTTLYT